MQMLKQVQHDNPLLRQPLRIYSLEMLPRSMELILTFEIALPLIRHVKPTIQQKIFILQIFMWNIRTPLHINDSSFS